MERIKINKHFNIIAKIRANDEREMSGFLRIKKIETLIKKCCGREPEINLRMIDLEEANLSECEKTLILESYANKISIGGLYLMN